MNEARLLQIHLGPGERHEGRPLYEVLVEKCRELGLSGATVFHGLDGIVVLTVDTAERIASAAAAFEPLLGEGAIAVEDVRVTRVRKG